VIKWQVPSGSGQQNSRDVGTGDVVREATLLVIRGVDQGTRFHLTDEALGIGRGVRNGVRILDTEVSRNHAALRFEDGAYIVTDRKSSNGTFVNGLAIRSHRLSPGDQITVGGTVLLFHEKVAVGQSVPVEIVPGLPGSDNQSNIVSSVDPNAGLQILERSVRRQDQSDENLATLQLLYEISEEMVSSSLSIEQLLQRLLDRTLDAVGADRGCMLVADPKDGQLNPRAVAIRRGDRSAHMPVSRSIVDYVIKNGQGVRTSDASADSRFAGGASIVREGIREALCVPMPGRYELMGVIYVDTTTGSASDQSTTASKFTNNHLRLLAAIGRQAALAVENSRYQDAFVKAERLAAVGQTIAILSHHIKNILQGVKGGSFLVDQGLDEEDVDAIRDGWDIVQRNQDRIYHLVTDMLTFSKERKPQLEPGNLNDVVKEVHELLQAQAALNEIDLRLRIDEDMPTSAFDSEAIHRAILNITGNALDAVGGREGATVEIRTGAADDGSDVWIEVADNGPGIPDDQRDDLFSLFESTKGTRGTGIGLAVSQKIAREHGGDIMVESEPNRGTRFRLIWPNFEDESRNSSRRTQQ
jgi:two-component system, NtrC family, sensor kinase